MPREITGRHVLAAFVGGFGVIIAVNVTLAVNAVRTFPGVETRNVYVASQTFDARRAAQQALGWQAAASYRDGTLGITLAGEDGAARPAAIRAVVGRPTMRTEDRSLALTRDGGGWTAPLRLAPGAWRVEVEAESPDGTPFRQRLDLWVAG